MHVGARYITHLPRTDMHGEGGRTNDAHVFGFHAVQVGVHGLICPPALISMLDGHLYLILAKALDGKSHHFQQSCSHPPPTAITFCQLERAKIAGSQTKSLKTARITITRQEALRIAEVV